MPSQPPISETAPLLATHTPSSIHHNATPQDSSDPAGLEKAETIGSTRLKIGATMFSFVILGLFTSSVGVMLPPISAHYDLTDLHVSFIFLAVPLGYVVAASSNPLIHSRFGQRGIAGLGPVLHVVSAVCVGLHPTFEVLLAAFAVMAMGTGLLDGSWCTYAAGMPNAGFVSGLLHGSFSVGAAVGPFCAGALMEKDMAWWTWYYALAATSVIALIVLLYAFRHANATHYHATKPQPNNDNTTSRSLTHMFRYPALYLSSLYFLTYVGIETAISGWIISYTLRYLHATPSLSSLSSSGFWSGMAAGRLVLGHSTDRIGVRRAATMYLLLAIGVQAVFAFMRSPVGAVVLMALLGACMGPLFPSGVVVLTRLLPPELHVQAVSFVSSLGQVGGAALPFGIGAFVDGVGIGVFRWVILGFTGLSLVVWLAFAGLKPTKGEGSVAMEREEDERED
ncbi:MFS general substrate transporter [Lentithecium fluviatile CBS 122367]|uniref:MFS general substrate transporter n=1 Tax=Lentithecium fluviatile CBS 122367 TaxID=1168545 RepID=A0A6G1IMJ8_9PLEO|nr:MFS general substrate transporter [Lentithecium fluviatile CBS 122367]